MKSIVLVVVVTLWMGPLVFLRFSVAQDPTRSKTKETDLTGLWEGVNHIDRNNDWGQVHLKATPGGFIGTYSDTFNRQLGSVTFRSIGDGKFEGFWWESDLNRYGSWQLELSNDGRSVVAAWMALSEGGAKFGKSTLRRK